MLQINGCCNNSFSDLKHRGRRKKCHLIEIESITLNAGVSMIFNVSPIPLNDGDYYKLLFSNNMAFPTGWTGEEAVFINMAGTTTPVDIPIGNWRGVVLESDKVTRGEPMCLVYTANSIAGPTPAPTGLPAFIVVRTV